MNGIYRVSIHGRTLESRNLQQLLARAVAEKRRVDRALRAYPVRPRVRAGTCVDSVNPFGAEAVAAQF